MEPLLSKQGGACLDPEPAASTQLPAEAYFEAAQVRALEAAVSAGGFVERDYRIAGASIRFRFAGAALVPRLSPALSHLAVPAANAPDLTVLLWDTVSTGTRMVPPPWSKAELRTCGEIESMIEQGCYAHYDVYHHAFTLFDPTNRRAIYWTRDAEKIPDHQTCSPLFPLFHSWMSRRGVHHVHAAAVGLPEGGVLLVGNSGAGKSSTTLACLDSPLRIAGDDRCLVAAEPRPEVHSLYCTAKSTVEDLEIFPRLQSGSRPQILQSGKLLHDLSKLCPRKLLHHFPLKAILMPRVSGARDSSLQPGSAALGLRVLAPLTLLRWPSLGRQTFQTLGRLFQRVPCYRLNLGSDRKQIPETILALLRS